MFPCKLLLVIIGLISSVLSQNTCTINSYKDVSNVVNTCTSITVGSVSVPGGKTLTFNLKRGTNIKFTGTVMFDDFVWTGPLMQIKGDHVTAEAATGAHFNGKGDKYWGSSSAKPTFLYLQGTGSTYNNLTLKNCPELCVAVDSSSDVKLYGWTIDNSAVAEGVAIKGKEGQNTVGFAIAKSSRVTIEHAKVTSQGDCVVITGGRDVMVDYIHCEGTNGLSIAAGIDKNPSNNIVYNATFQNAVMKKGKNAILIKTFSDGGSGKIDKILYDNIVLKEPTDYGILIIQHSSLKAGDFGGALKGNVPITNVRIDNVTGDMYGKEKWSTSVTIVCAPKACDNFNFENISITGFNALSRCTYQPKGFKCNIQK